MNKKQMSNWFLIVIVFIEKKHIAFSKNTYIYWLFDIYISTLWTHLTLQNIIAGSSYKQN